MLETLRIQSPVPTTTYTELIKDAKIGDINMRKGDKFTVTIHALHYNANEWQRPYEFLPERFDNSNPLSLTPNLQKRKTFSWAPFSGGKRVCFGKTFAEASLKIVATYLT